MTPDHSGEAGRGLERSCAEVTAEWIRQSETTGGVQLFEARLRRLAYRRHRHDTYAIGVTASGVQAFVYRGESHISLPGQVVVLHPDEAHDGHAGTETGFAYRQLYIDPAAVSAATRALSGPSCALPFVRQPVTTNAVLAATVRAAFRQDLEPLAIDDLIARLAAGLLVADPGAGRLHPLRRHDLAAIARARSLLDVETTRVVRSEELEDVTGLSRYELARQFRAVVGTSPYRYSLLRRLDVARARIAQGQPLVDVSLATGFADQAHLTRRFVAAFGFTPGKYGALARRVIG